MAQVSATVTGSIAPVTYTVYESTDLATALATGSTLPLSFTPLSGAHNYVLVTSSNAGGCVDISAPFPLNCSVDLINIDIVFGLGASARCDNYTNIANDFDFKIVDEDNTSSEYLEESIVGGLVSTDKTIPNGSAIVDAYVIAPPTRSCGGSFPNCTSGCPIAYYRFGLGLGSVVDAYPSKNIFTYAVYGRKNSTYNDSADNFFYVRLNKFTTCSFTAIVGAPVNGVDYQRTGTCGSLGFTDYPTNAPFTRYELPTATTTYMKVGDLIYDKTTQTIIFDPVPSVE